MQRMFMMRSRFPVFACGAIAAGLVATAAVALRAGGPITLGVTGRANANLSLASEGSFVAAVWSAALENGTTDIYAAASADGGATFSPPMRVNSTAGEARVNGEQAPRVALAARPGGVPRIDVVWTATREKRDILLTARSTDGGRSFATASVVPGSDAGGRRGWASIDIDANGTALVTWLDHRRMAERDSQMAAMQHGDSPGAGRSTTANKPSMTMPELSQLYVATLDGSAARPVTDSVCFCCKTATAFGRAGEVYVAWRHVYSGNLRDMAVAWSGDGGRTFAPPVRVSEDKWAINGCPEDGPVLAVDRQARLHIVWPTVVNEGGEPVKALFHAVSRDGRVFSDRMRLPTKGQANHPRMAFAGDESLAVAWDESGDGSRRVALARGVPRTDGGVGFERLASSGSRTGTYPAVAHAPEGFVLAWTTGDPATSTIRIESVR